MIKIFLAIFETGHYAADQVYFYESIYKKSANLAGRQVFTLKNPRDLKNKYFLQIPAFYSKEQSQGKKIQNESL